MRRVEPDGGLNVINEVTDVNGSHPSMMKIGVSMWA